MTDAKATVLVVDDEQLVRETIALMLGEMGYAVIEASSGQEALEASARHKGPIDLLITDLIMPGMTGRFLADALVARRPGLPVVFMSGHIEGAHQKELEPGVLFLEKPVDGNSLKRKIQEALKKQV